MRCSSSAMRPSLSNASKRAGIDQDHHRIGPHLARHLDERRHQRGEQQCGEGEQPARAERGGPAAGKLARDRYDDRERRDAANEAERAVAAERMRRRRASTGGAANNRKAGASRRAGRCARGSRSPWRRHRRCMLRRATAARGAMWRARNHRPAATMASMAARPRAAAGRGCWRITAGPLPQSSRHRSGFVSALAAKRERAVNHPLTAAVRRRAGRRRGCGTIDRLTRRRGGRWRCRRRPVRAGGSA